MQLELLNAQGQATSKVDAPDTLFARDYNEALVHQIVVAFQANARQGTRAQMDRAEVKHSTKKPWRQKGTGRARAGMTSSPLWRGGGRTFPNSPDENFSQKVNKKMYRAGLCSILSQLARENRIAVVDGFSLEAPKTKLLAQKFKAMGLESLLLITDGVDENLLLAARNLANVLVVEPKNADILGQDSVIVRRRGRDREEAVIETQPDISARPREIAGVGHPAAHVGNLLPLAEKNQAVIDLWLQYSRAQPWHLEFLESS